MEKVYTLVGIFLYGFIIVITLIGITNIFNTITTNMELRKPEFAMLKSIGMTTKEFNRMIRLETIFMGIKSLLFSIPIGIVLSYIIYNSLDVSQTIKFAIPLKEIVIAIIAVFLLINVIMKYSMSKINKQNTIETIRNENI
jgi:putative ABC transport system permease protein